jgi:hypothetical protein
MSIIQANQERYVFINNCFGAFFRGVLDWFGDDFYPRTKYKVMGTYDKAIQFFNDKRRLGHDTDTNLLPSITLDPNLDFSPEERGGRFLRQTYYLDPLINRRLFNSINLLDQDSLLTPVFSRYEGTMEVIFWLTSIYELLDLRTYLFQYTGGFGRYIRPKYFNSYIIIPDEIKNFEWSEGHILDWNNTDGTFLLIDNMNQIKYVMPVVLNPIMKLESLNDNSTKYGGDQIAEYKLSIIMKWELELPTYMLLSNKVGDCRVNYNFAMSKVYTKYDWQPPYEILKNMAAKDDYLQRDLLQAREFEISDKEITPSVEFSDSIVNPKPEELIQWCPIVSGKLVRIINTSTEVTKNDIIYFDDFNDYNMHQLRMCKAAFCRRGTYSSTLIMKSRILNKPVLINSTMPNSITSLFNSDITLDVFNEKIYSGNVEIREISNTEPHFGEKTLRILKEKNKELYDESVKKDSEKTPLKDTIYDGMSAKKVLIGKGDGTTTLFETNIVLPDRFTVFVDDTINSDFTIQNTTQLVFNHAPKIDSYIFYSGSTNYSNNTKLIAVYQFTEEDESKTTVSISFPFSNIESNDIIINSYTGILKEGINWELDTENNIINLLNVKAKREELVEIFALYKDE